MGKGKSAPGGGTITIKRGRGWWVCESECVRGDHGATDWGREGAPASPDPPRHSAAANVPNRKASSEQLA